MPLTFGIMVICSIIDEIIGGKRPGKGCGKPAYCSIVLNAKRKGDNAIARCDITGSTICLGYPFDCETVAQTRR